MLRDNQPVVSGFLGPGLIAPLGGDAVMQEWSLIIIDDLGLVSVAAVIHLHVLVVQGLYLCISGFIYACIKYRPLKYEFL